MELITMILSGLALLAAGVSLILTFQEKKRNEKRNTAALQYIDRYIDILNANIGKTQEQYTALDERVGNLEHGICPDFESAREAAKAVNDFNAGLSAIMNFDPIEEAKKARERAQYGGSE